MYICNGYYPLPRYRSLSNSWLRAQTTQLQERRRDVSAPRLWQVTSTSFTFPRLILRVMSCARFFISWELQLYPSALFQGCPVALLKMFPLSTTSCKISSFAIIVSKIYRPHVCNDILLQHCMISWRCYFVRKRISFTYARCPRGSFACVL